MRLKIVCDFLLYLYLANWVVGLLMAGLNFIQERSTLLDEYWNALFYVREKPPGWLFMFAETGRPGWANYTVPASWRVQRCVLLAIYGAAPIALAILIYQRIRDIRINGRQEES